MSGVAQDDGVECDIQPGHIAYMCFTSTMVLLQTPATGITQAGMMRRKSALSMLMQTITGMVIGSILWFVVGYTLVYAPSIGGFIGHPTRAAFLWDVPVDSCVAAAPHIPGVLFAAFQMMFALMTPVLVTGSWAEKLTFEAFLVFVIVWPFLVYYPLAHWIWANGGWLKELGVLDFAGGLVIHASSGVAGLVVASMLARRATHEQLGDAHHNLPLMFVGAIFVFCGWYSFNGGSAYAANGQSAQALLSTHISACTGGLCWLFLSWYFDDGPTPIEVTQAATKEQLIQNSPPKPSTSTLRRRRSDRKMSNVHSRYSLNAGPGDIFYEPRTPSSSASLARTDSFIPMSVIGSADAKATSDSLESKIPHKRHRRWHMKEIVSGVLAGLASITAGSGYVAAQSAFFIGIGAALTSYATVVLVRKMRVDDVLDVMALQGTPGIWGTFAVGWAARSIEDFSLGETPGVLYGGGLRLLGVQTLAIIVTVLWSAFWTYLLFKVMSHFMDVEVPPHVEARGLDVCQIGEHAYDLDEYGHPVFTTSADTALLAARLCDAASQGNIAEVKWLLRIGAEASGRDYDQRSPLHLAAAEGHLAVCKVLLSDASVDVNALDRWGNTPLMEAIVREHQQVTALLISFGAELPVEDPLGVCSLCAAAAAGQTNEIELYLRRGVDVNGSDYDRRTALHVAATEGNAEICRILLNAGADPQLRDRKGDTALDNARRYGHKKVQEILAQHSVIDQKSLNNPTAMLTIDQPNDSSLQFRNDLLLPARNGIANIGLSESVPNPTHLSGDAQVCRPLSRYNSTFLSGTTQRDVRRATRSTSDTAAPQQTTAPARPLTADVSVSTQQLCAAAAEGDISEVKRLVRKGADPKLCNYDGRTPLHLAACNDHLVVVKYLCELPGIDIQALDRYKRTPLAEAIRSNAVTVARYLRDLAPAQSESDLGHTLCSAAASGHISTIQRLYESGADVSTADYDGRTALHLAAAEGHYQIVDWLINIAGVNMFAEDRWGDTPIDEARRNHRVLIEQLLNKALISHRRHRIPRREHSAYFVSSPRSGRTSVTSSFRDDLTRGLLRDFQE